MTAVLIFEAIDTASAILNAILVWIVAAAFVVTVGLFTTVVAVAQGWKAARKALSGPLAAEQPPQGPESTPSPQRRSAPSWARADHDHQEAA